MEPAINMAKDLVKHRKIIAVNDKVFDVLEHTVSIQKKPGRRIMTCTCYNGTQYCNEGICYHKIAVLLYLTDKNFYQKIDKITNDYKRIKDLKLKVSPDMIINDLEELRRVK